MNILVTVASKHGSTWAIGEQIAHELRVAGHTVDLTRPDEVTSLNDYDAVVLGSAIYAGSWLPAARDFATLYQPQLRGLPLWVFSSGPLGSPPQPQDDPKKLAGPVGTIPVRDHRVFVGALDPQDLGFAERLIVRAVKAPAGDFRDWAAIQAWASDIAAALPVAVH
jgi:menaquinone-dependent protoporphyrinogen oxidase